MCIRDRAVVFLDAPIQAWQDLDVPLLARTVNPYQPLFTRIDPKMLDTMTEASRDTLGAAPAAVATPVANKKSVPVTVATSVASATDQKTIAMDDFAKLDLRIGKVLALSLIHI